MLNKVFFLLFSAFIASAAAATELKPLSSCHQLMTDKECGDHLTQLAALAPGEALDRYLAEFARVQKEREGACHCQQQPTGWTRMPLQRQALLRR